MGWERMVRVGTVTDLDPGKKKARIKLQGENIPSGWLLVLQGAGDWMPKINDTVLALYIPVFQGDGYILGRIP